VAGKVTLRLVDAGKMLEPLEAAEREASTNGLGTVLDSDALWP
jgi:hypothetical protein